MLQQRCIIVKACNKHQCEHFNRYTNKCDITGRVVKARKYSFPKWCPLRVIDSEENDVATDAVVEEIKRYAAVLQEEMNRAVNKLNFLLSNMGLPPWQDKQNQ